MVLYNEFIQGIYTVFENLFNFEHRNIFSRRVSLEYDVESDSPWLFFKHSDDKYSFKIHNLEFGSGESPYWHSNTQKKVEFKGFSSLFYSKDRGYLRGYLSMGDYHKIGIFVKKGRVIKLKTQEELHEDVMKITEPMIDLIMMQKGDSSKSRLEDRI